MTERRLPVGAMNHTPSDPRPSQPESPDDEPSHGASRAQPPVVRRTGNANVPTAAEGSLDDDSRSEPAA